MQTAIDYVATALAWAVTLFRLTAVLKDRRRSQSPRVLRAWLFALFIALFLTFQVDAVYTAVDAFVGVNNLSWLFSYLSAAVAIYFVCTGFCRERPYWMLCYLVVAASLLVVVFPFGPGRVPESADHVVPGNASELLFVGLFYFYAATMFAIVPMPASVRAFLKEGQFPVRLRAFVILLTLLLTIVFYLTKFSIFSLSFFVPSLSLSFLHYVTDAVRLVGAAMAVMWPLSFASNRFFWALNRPIGFFQKILTLRELNALKTRINRLCSPVLLDQATWLDQLRNLDFYVYRSVIGILDGRKLLADQLGQWDGGMPVDLRSWDGQCSQEAIHLHQALQGVPEEPSFECLVDSYRSIGRQLRKGAVINQFVN